MPRVQGHRAPRGLGEEGVGPCGPISSEFRRPVEKTLLGGDTPASAHHPPIILGTSVVAVTVHGNGCHLWSQSERRDVRLAGLWEVLGVLSTSPMQDGQSEEGEDRED